MRPGVLSACAGTVIVLVAAGCGGGGGSGGSSSESEGTTSSSGSGGGAPVKTIRIVETEYSLSPNTVSISKPGLYVIEGVNQGTVTHAIAIEGNGIDMDGPEVSPGGTSTVRVTIAKKGSYELYCPVSNHKDLGMEGHLTLGSGGGSGGTSTEDHTSTGTSTSSSGGYGYG